MIVHLPTAKLSSLPSEHAGLTRVDHNTALGVTFNNTLSCGPHVSHTTAKAAASLYALKTLRRHGLQGQALCDVARATLVAQLLYASPAWSGFITAEEKSKLQSVLTKASHCGFLPFGFVSLDELFKSADHTLFTAAANNSEHVLHRLLPARKETGYNLRKRTHGFILPEAQSCYLRKNFLVRMLFTDIY